MKRFITWVACISAMLSTFLIYIVIIPRKVLHSDLGFLGVIALIFASFYVCNVVELKVTAWLYPHLKQYKKYGGTK